MQIVKKKINICSIHVTVCLNACASLTGCLLAYPLVRLSSCPVPTVHIIILFFHRISGASVRRFFIFLSPLHKCMLCLAFNVQYSGGQCIVSCQRFCVNVKIKYVCVCFFLFESELKTIAANEIQKCIWSDRIWPVLDRLKYFLFMQMHSWSLFYRLVISNFNHIRINRMDKIASILMLKWLLIHSYRTFISPRYLFFWQYFFFFDF